MALKDTGTGEGVADSTKKKMELPSLWKANIYAFLVIFLVSVSVAFWQTRYINSTFLKDAQDHARLAAEIIKINAHNAVEAKNTSRKIVASFLRSQARFIRYLENVEPFTPEEIWAFSKESGLAGITIMNTATDMVTESEKNWLPLSIKKLCKSGKGLRQVPSRKLFIYVSPEGKDRICIITGIDATDILEIQRRISLENTLREITNLSGVRYAKVISREEACRLRNGWGCPETCDKNRNTLLLDTKDGPVVQVEFEISRDQILLLGMDASELKTKQRHIWHMLLLFSAILFITGGVVTYVLYRHQKNYIEKIKDFEKQLFAEKHEASLGRSAATIAHEIRNPLNAVSMGIQRLLMNKQGLKKPDIALLNLMKNEIARTEKIVSGLLEYAKPSKIDVKEVCLKDMLRDTLLSAQSRKKTRGISVNMKISKDHRIKADPNLLRQLFENLLINSLEAMDKGGDLDIEVFQKGHMTVIKISNSGQIPDEKDLPKLFEPYFTTKTKGTGLGLAICKKIVKAHKGKINANIQGDRLVIEVVLPAGEDK